MTKPLSYARAEELRPLITRSALTPRGEVEVDSATEYAHHPRPAGGAAAATDLIATLDTPQPQVEIEARIVQTNRDFARSLGVQWGFGGRMSPRAGQHAAAGVPEPGQRRRPHRRRPRPDARRAATAVNLPVPGATCAIGLALGSVNGAFNLDVALSALETNGQGASSPPRACPRRTTSRPRLRRASQIPIQTVANNTVTVTFKDAALTLQRHAADHRGQHGDHEDLARERAPRLQPQRQRHSADRHPARA